VANMPLCLIGMEACVGAHHLSRRLRLLGHDPRLMPAKYVRPYSKGRRTTSATRRPRPSSARCWWYAANFLVYNDYFPIRPPRVKHWVKQNRAVHGRHADAPHPIAVAVAAIIFSGMVRPPPEES
jgi:hypothetical protein